MRIEKYALPMYFGGSISYTDNFVKILDLLGKDDYSVLWAMVDDSAALKQIKVMCIPTGAVWDQPKGEYLGTVEDGKGGEWHYFIEI